jgi:hypothetical protein
MNLFPKQSLESLIITHLQQKTWVIVELIRELQKSKPTLSKQAVYQVLRNLKKIEIVIITSKRVSLSSIWIHQMNEFFEKAKNAYEGSGVSPESFMNLADGDRIVYEFKNPHATDVFWGHVFNLLINDIKKGEPILIYNPHQWILLMRPESETRLMKHSESIGHPWFTYIPSKGVLDKYTKSLFSKPSSCYLGDKEYIKSNRYVNLLGDFIIETDIDLFTHTEIDRIFNTESDPIHAQQQLISLISLMRGRNKLIISRNHKKSEKYRKIFKKYFLI